MTAPTFRPAKSVSFAAVELAVVSTAVVLQNSGLVKETLFWRSSVTPSPAAARSYWWLVSPASDDVTEVDL